MSTREKRWAALERTYRALGCTIKNSAVVALVADLLGFPDTSSAGGICQSLALRGVASTWEDLRPALEDLCAARDEAAAEQRRKSDAEYELMETQHRGRFNAAWTAPAHPSAPPQRQDRLTARRPR